MLTELQRALKRSPGGLAVRSLTPQGERIDTTWAQLHATTMAAAARARQLPPDRPVTVMVDGTAASIATVIGVIAAGLDAVLLEERTSYLSDPSSPVHAVEASVTIGPAALAGGASGTRYEEYERFRSSAGGHEPAPATRSEILQLTSGSTGVPRIARQPLSNVIVGGELYQQLFEMTEDDRVLIAVPLAHSYGLAGLCSALVAGATIVTLPRFSLSSLVKGLGDGATMLLGTPLLYRLLTPVLAARRPDLCLRTALSAGGPMPAHVDDITAALGTPVRQIYGTTEAGLIACVPQSATHWPTGSVGFAAPGVTLRLDPLPDGPQAGTPVAHEGGGQTGRLLVRTPMMFSGYWGSEEPGLTEDGYYDTGDNTRLAPAGHVFVLGRKDNIVNIGGRKVSPQRVERVISEHTAVREAFVFGVERADKEQEMHAAIALAPGTGIDDVIEYCRSQSLQPYEIPHRVHVLDRLPRNSMGKVDRQEVLAATGHLPGPSRPLSIEERIEENIP